MVWRVKSLVALQLVLLFLTSFSSHAKALAEGTLRAPGGRIALPPLLSPMPLPSPLLPPSPSPSMPYRPPRSKTLNIAIEGIVYCKSCRLPYYVKTMDASPLPGVVVRVRCSIGKYVMSKTGKTDARGYFLILAPKVLARAVFNCRAYTASLPPCNRPVYPPFLSAGVPLKYERLETIGNTKYALLTAGLLEFAPAKPKVCPRIT